MWSCERINGDGQTTTVEEADLDFRKAYEITKEHGPRSIDLACISDMFGQTLGILAVRGRLSEALQVDEVGFSVEGQLVEAMDGSKITERSDKHETWHLSVMPD